MNFAAKLENKEWRESLPKFWADDFDMDLLAVFPDIREMLGDTINTPIWTVSHETYGRLNCPNFWHGIGSILWLQKPNLPRDKHGWASIDGYVTQSQEIEGTWLEWLRDMWVHAHPWVVFPHGVSFAPVDYNGVFYPIMSHRRGWHPDPDIETRYRNARFWIEKANNRFRRLCENDRTASGSSTQPAQIG